MSTKTGVLLTFDDDPELAAAIEAWGYDSLWCIEGQGMASFGRLERWATVTDEIQLGTGIVNVFSRTPAALAQEIATLDTHSGGRALLGMGVAHPGVVENFHGMTFDRPLERMVEYITLVRRYLAGVSDPFDGEFFSPKRTSLWEAFEPERDAIPIYNAAIGPNNVRLTGEYADGWLPYLMPRNRFEEAKEWLAEGARNADRGVEEIELGMLVLSAVHEERAVARRLVAETIATYFRDIPGYYTRVAKNAGFEADVRAAQAAHSTEAAIDEISDEFIDLVSIADTPEGAQDRLEEFRAAGLDHPLIYPAPMAERDVLEGMLEALAPD